MNTSELLLIGIKGSVLALHRDTGAQVWATHLKGSDFVNVTLDNGRIYATTYGEVFCLDAATGDALWHNPLKGFGMGLATMALENNVVSGIQAALAERRRRDQRSSADGTPPGA